MSDISVIQILRKEKLDSGLTYKQIIQNNETFLRSVKVEYIVFDTLTSHEVLRSISEIQKFSPIPLEGLKYYRQNFKSTKDSMLQAAQLANGKKLIYLKSEDLLTLENVEQTENTRPHIFKKDIDKIKRIKKENFSYNDFHILIKDKKTFWERLRLLFI